jgi:Zn-dependent membrane protease YugP
MPFGFFDPTIVLLLPALAFAMWAQHKVKSTYAKYSQIGNRAGLTGGQVAQHVMHDADVPSRDNRYGMQTAAAVGLESIPGHLTDHYDPRSRTLRLSDEVYHGQSVAALGIAAHEVGHAIQHNRAYAPLMLRNVVYPITSIGSMGAFPLFIAGLLIPSGLGQTLMLAAIGLFTLAVMFTVITLPVEFDASRRAVKALASGGYLTEDELAGAKKVLNAAALTYVAATAMAVMNLVRMILIANSRN